MFTLRVALLNIENNVIVKAFNALVKLMISYHVLFVAGLTAKQS